MTGKRTSVSLGDDLTAFVEGQIGRGRYSDAGEIMRAGPRLLERHEAELEAVRAALIDGEESGVSSRRVTDIWEAVSRKENGEASVWLCPFEESGRRYRGDRPGDHRTLIDYMRRGEGALIVRVLHAGSDTAQHL